MTRTQRLAGRLEAQARALPIHLTGSRRGLPVDPRRGATLAARYRVVKAVLMREAREAFARLSR